MDDLRNLPPASSDLNAMGVLTRREIEARILDLLFCQGCYTEMLGPGVYDAIRHFATQGKVFYVHFRNIVGTATNFRETFIDSGQINMFEAMKAWKEVGFDGAMIPDHLPHVTGDTEDGRAARAHAIGYMKALMTAVGAGGAGAATFTVNTTSDTDDGTCNGAHCSLREALAAARTVGAASRPLQRHDRSGDARLVRDRREHVRRSERQVH